MVNYHMVLTILSAKRLSFKYLWSSRPPVFLLFFLMPSSHEVVPKQIYFKMSHDLFPNFSSFLPAPITVVI